MFAQLRSDLEAARRRDPAARSLLEIGLLYPGVHAVWGHRLSHRLWGMGWRFPARASAELCRLITGVDIHPAARLGPGLFIDHAVGVVIGETAEVGADVTLYQGVTLGGTSLEAGKRHPTLGDRVTVGAGAKVLGPITVGDDSRIGANAVVVKAVPANSVVVGVPGQVIARSRPRSESDTPDLEVTLLPDLVGTSLAALLRRVDQLETALHGRTDRHDARPSEAGIWSGEDFSI